MFNDDLFSMFGYPLDGGPLSTAEKALAEVMNREDRLREVLERTKLRAQNNIDRSFNRGVDAAGGPASLKRKVRYPEFGTS